MSRIAPDIPELQRVPEALRSIAYTRALNRAIRTPLTWLLGGVLFAIAVGVGLTQGKALMGVAGAALGAVVGAALAGLCFFRLLLPWRTRRVLPSLTNQAELEALDHARRAGDSLERMAAAIEAHDGNAGDAAQQRARRSAGRIPKKPR